MNLGDIMDEIAEKLGQAPSLAGRTFAYPPGSISAPAAIVQYPEDGTFDETYGRGKDRMTGEMVLVAVGGPYEPQSRDNLTKYIDGSGPESIKALLEGEDDDYDSCDGVSVTGWRVGMSQIGATWYLTVAFDLDIIGPGTA